ELRRVRGLFVRADVDLLVLDAGFDRVAVETEIGEIVLERITLLALVLEVAATAQVQDQVHVRVVARSLPFPRNIQLVSIDTGRVWPRREVRILIGQVRIIEPVLATELIAQVYTGFLAGLERAVA